MGSVYNRREVDGWASGVTVNYSQTSSTDNTTTYTFTIYWEYRTLAGFTHKDYRYTRVAVSEYPLVSYNDTTPTGYDKLGLMSYIVYPSSTSTSVTARTTSAQTFTVSRDTSSSVPMYITIWNFCHDNESYDKTEIVYVPIAKHRITYNANGGSGAPSDQTADYNMKIGITKTAPTRTGRTFLGWSKTSSGSAASDRAPGGVFPAYAASEILYAVWSPELRDLVVSRECATGVSLPANMGMVLRTQFYINDYTSCTLKIGSVSISPPITGAGTKNNIWGSSNGLNVNTFDPTKAHTISLTAANSKGSRTISATLPASGYIKPTITSLSAYRYNTASGTPVDDGIHPMLRASGRVYRTKDSNNQDSIVTCAIRLIGEDGSEIGSNSNPIISSTVWNVNDPRSTVTLDPEKYYKYEITVADPLYSVTRTVVIDTAFMAMDILGDMLWYQPSTDTSVVSGKKYFTKTTVNGVDAYTRVESPSGNPSTSDYYERSGDRPASGVAFGTSSDSSGFRVAMPTKFEQGVTAYNDSYSSPRYTTLDDHGLVYHDSHGNDQRVFRIFDNEGENSGNAVVIGAGDDGDMGGAVMIGAGECAQDIDELSDVTAGIEDLFLAADGTVRMYPAWANKAQVNVYQSGTITKIDCIAGSNNNVVLGTSSNNGVTAQTYIGELHFKDKNKEPAAMLGARTNVSDNGIYAYMGARNCKTDGTFITNYIYSIVKKDGTRAYKVDDAAAFRSAIGVNTLGTKSSVTLSTTTITYTGSNSVGANTAVAVELKTASASIPSGYVFTGVKQVTTSDSGCGVVGWTYNGTNSTARLRNFTSSSKSSVTVTMVAVYAKPTVS